MEYDERNGYSLHNGIKIADFMKNAKYGEVVELTDGEGNTNEFTFEAAVIRGKDLCHYVRLNRGGVALTLIANFKHNKFFDISHIHDNVKIKTELNNAIEQKLKINAEMQKRAMCPETSETYDSFFTGGMLANFFIKLLTGFVNLITLGLTYPLMLCKYMNWETRHTWINGRQLIFTGKAANLYGKYLLWYFLSVITLGIYYIVKMRLNLVEWQTKNTHIKGNKFAESHFSGKWYQLLGVTIVHNLVITITLSFGMYWAHCYIERWYAKHTSVDGLTEQFTGTGLEYFGKCFVWTLLTVITLGIYSFWLAIKSKKWTVKHTVFSNPGQLKILPTAFAEYKKMSFVSVM